MPGKLNILLVNASRSNEVEQLFKQAALTRGHNIEVDSNSILLVVPYLNNTNNTDGKLITGSIILIDSDAQSQLKANNKNVISNIIELIENNHASKVKVKQNKLISFIQLVMRMINKIRILK